jgi:hypothetical protein
MPWHFTGDGRPEWRSPRRGSTRSLEAADEPEQARVTQFFNAARAGPRSGRSWPGPVATAMTNVPRSSGCWRPTTKQTFIERCRLPTLNQELRGPMTGRTLGQH